MSNHKTSAGGWDALLDVYTWAGDLTALPRKPREGDRGQPKRSLVERIEDHGNAMLGHHFSSADPHWRSVLVGLVALHQRKLAFPKSTQQEEQRAFSVVRARYGNALAQGLFSRLFDQVTVGNATAADLFVLSDLVRHAPKKSELIPVTGDSAAVAEMAGRALQGYVANQYPEVRTPRYGAPGGTGAMLLAATATAEAIDRGRNEAPKELLVARAGLLYPFIADLTRREVAVLPPVTQTICQEQVEYMPITGDARTALYTTLGITD